MRPTGAGGGVPPPPSATSKSHAHAHANAGRIPFEELAPYFLHEHRDREASFSLGEKGESGLMTGEGTKKMKRHEVFFFHFLRENVQIRPSFLLSMGNSTAVYSRGEMKGDAAFPYFVTQGSETE